MTVYLIDGYNVLYQLRERRRGEQPREPRGKRRHAGPGAKRGPLRPRTGEKPGGAMPTLPLDAGSDIDLEDERRRLVDRIASYMGRTSDRAIVVFDSHSQVLQKTESATANVEVYFGSFSRSADSVIEREVYALSSGESVVVVSSDYQLQKTIFLPNVIRRSSRQFVADLQQDTKMIANSKNCIIMGHRVEERVDPETVDRLKMLRDELAAGAAKPDTERQVQTPGRPGNREG